MKTTVRLNPSVESWLSRQKEIPMCRRLATSRGVELTLIEADLATFELGEDAWSGIVSIFAHTPAPVRQRVHAAVAVALHAGGTFLLEAYRPEQIVEGQRPGTRLGQIL